MIVISDKNKPTTVYFPQNIYTDATDDYTVILHNRGTNRTYTIDCTDLHLVSYDFYSFAMDFSKIPSDEYEYALKDSNNSIVSKGIIRVSSLKSTNTCYNKNNTYIAYGTN